MSITVVSCDDVSLRHRPAPTLLLWVTLGSLSRLCTTPLGTCWYCKGRVYKYTDWDLVEKMETQSRLRCPCCKGNAVEFEKIVRELRKVP